MKHFTTFVGVIAVAFISIVSVSASAQVAAEKPRITLDEFFNYVDYTGLNLAPDGKALLIGTERSDWGHNRFRKDLWLWREGMTAPILLTNSGRDTDARWSPDGKWIAFLSERPTEPEPQPGTQPVPNEARPTAPPNPKPQGRDEDEQPAAKTITQLYLISTSGGEAFPVTRGIESVHEFAWSPDSQMLYFATRTPWSKQKRDAYKAEWKDVVQYRESERGDVVARIRVTDAVARQSAISELETKPEIKKEGETAETPGAEPVTTTPFKVDDLVASPDGSSIAFTTDSVSGRVEGVSDYEIYLAPANGGSPRRLTNNEAVESDLHWSPDSQHILFSVGSGSIEKHYEHIQNRIYSIDVKDGKVQRWAGSFGGNVEHWELAPDGSVVSSARLGTNVAMYTEASAAARFRELPSWKGTYKRLATATHSNRVAFVFSALGRPGEVYIADSPQALETAKPVTAFNKLFTERALPQGKTYTWKADDGRQIEGMLLYPPGKFEAKHLPMFLLIHGGPEDADGDQFGADWYDWGILAATQGYLVFRPNYRGSTGYGDDFMREIVPHIVSRPGKDILEGVDALVRDGIADPDRLFIGGYSYGGYMTNWLITQTTRFKAAVTGAGAIEHAANWGNDDLTFDDAWYLGGTPWENENVYNEEAALWQINKVKTPTHMVAGADDIRVSVAEDYLLERALHTLNVPSTLLIFPGEGHSLAKNPWHGKIKVREEIKWLQKYGGPKP
ncbi:MAG: prolyl oligopeptidase family serine peptidase [Terriglobia bacterium]|nr:prolyl oligopeptidase family serine peptidase [Terriglobia bacterium]